MSASPSDAASQPDVSKHPADLTQSGLLDTVERIVGYRFNDPDLLDTATRHASSADSRLQSNERMEFFGDAVLGHLVCEHLYHEYPELLEGDMTKIKSAVVSRKACARVAQKLGLKELLTLGKGMSSRAKLPQSVLAGVVESLIAAMYLDGGIDAARNFVVEHLGPLIEESANSSHHQNYKSTLQQFCQRRGSPSPHYVLVDEKGPDHAKAFEVAVEMDGQRHESHWAPSKKEAEQGAALNALVGIGLATRHATGLVTVSPEAG